MQVLVDTSVWIDHLHRADPEPVGFLQDTLVSRTMLWTRDRLLPQAADELLIHVKSR